MDAEKSSGIEAHGSSTGRAINDASEMMVRQQKANASPATSDSEEKKGGDPITGMNQVLEQQSEKKFSTFAMY